MPATNAEPGKTAYKETLKRWLHLNKPARETGDADAISAIGQAAGFLTPASPRRRIRLSLSSGPGIVDLLRLAAWQVGNRDAKERTVANLQDVLVELGLFTRTGGVKVQHRLPKGAIHEEAPPGAGFEAALRAQLTAMSLLDTASDGASMIRSPWGKA